MHGVKQIFARGLEGLALVMAVGAAFCIVGIVAVITLGVVMRRVVGAPLHFTEDVVGLMLSAVLFLGLPLVTLRSQHVRVSIVANALERRLPWAVHIAAMLVGVVFFGWIFVVALPWLEFAWARNLKSETARLLLYPWMASLPLSIGLTWVIFMARLTGLLTRDTYTPLEDLPQFAASDRES